MNLTNILVCLLYYVVVLYVYYNLMPSQITLQEIDLKYSMQKSNIYENKIKINQNTVSTVLGSKHKIYLLGKWS